MAAATGPQSFGSTSGTMPAYDAFTITPSDSVNFSSPCRAFLVGVAGNVAIVTPSGNVVTLTGLLAGVIYPIVAIRINSTNTTATSLVGLV